MEEQSGSRVLVVDDDRILIDTVRRGLTQLGYQVAGVLSGPEALEQLQQWSPDVVLLDVSMPGMSGLETCRALRELSPRLPVVFLTARDTAEDEVRGLLAGGDDYITKPFDFRVLDARLQTVLRRQLLRYQEPLRVGDITVELLAHRVMRGSREVALTDTEFRLLAFLTEHQGAVMSKQQIIDRVWGYDFEGDANIVEVYVAALRRKLEADAEDRLIHTVRGSGYVLREG